MSERTPPFTGEDVWKNVRYSDVTERVKNQFGTVIATRRGLSPYERLSVVKTTPPGCRGFTIRFCCDDLVYETPGHAYAAWIFSKPERPGE